MSTLRITNVSGTPLWLRDLYTELSPGETATITRTPAEMGDMIGLQGFITEGLVSVDIDLDPHEAPSELVAVWPLGLNWRPTVADAAALAALPIAKNRLGDVRLVINTLSLHAWNGAAWQALGGGGGGGVTNVTASAPIASSGGVTPNISLTGIVAVANGGTGLSAPGAAGNVLTSNGAGGWTSSAIPAPPADDWTRTGTVLSPTIAGDSVQVEIAANTVGITVSDTPTNYKTELFPAVATLTDNLKVAELSASSAQMKLRGDSGEGINPTIRTVDFDDTPYALDLQIRELSVNGAVGVAGEVLTSNGPGAAPTWGNPLAGSFVLGTSAVQTITAATDQITPTSPLHRIQTNGSNYSLTSTPQINLPSAVLGQVLFIQNVDPVNHVSFQRGAAEELALSNSTSKLDPGGTLLLVFNGSIWIEVSHTGGTTT